MNSGACSTMRVPEAARGFATLLPPRGTVSKNLAAASLHPPTASAGRGSPSTAPSGVTIPARASQVAAPMPGGGGLYLVVEAPANPSPEDPQWSRHTTPSRSSTASATCSKRASRSRKSALSMVSRADRRSGAGVRAMMSSPVAYVRLARSAISHSPKKAWPWLSRLRLLLLPTPKPLGSHSTLSGGSWASSRSHSATSPSSRGQ